MITIVGRPVSKKNSKQIIRVGGKPVIISSKGYRAFERDALWQLKACKERYKGSVDVSYTFEMKGKLDVDLDNAIAGINDILQKSGIIDNDKNIVSMTANKEGGCETWKTHIQITSVK